MIRSSVLALIASAGVAAFPAAATVIVSFGFTDLAGTYSGGVFSTADDADTSGDVTRIEAPSSTADYNVGFSGGTAAVTTSVSVFGIIGNTASGVGSFTITDANGDVLTGTITGTWIGSGLGIFFNGDLSGVYFDGTNGDGQFFDGPSGGSFDYTSLSGIPPYEGAIVQLFVPVAGFFSSDFTVESVQVLGEIVPGSGPLAILGLAGFAASRRRRA